jgi:hypothetical protein
MILAISSSPFLKFLTQWSAHNLAPVAEGPLKADLNFLSAALILGGCGRRAAKIDT